MPRINISNINKSRHMGLMKLSMKIKTSFKIVGSMRLRWQNNNKSPKSNKMVQPTTPSSQKRETTLRTSICQIQILKGR